MAYVMKYDKDQVRFQSDKFKKHMFKGGSATGTPLQVELKGVPNPLAMTPVVGEGSFGQPTGDEAEEM